MIGAYSLSELVGLIGSKLGTDWRTVPPDKPYKISETRKLTVECWLHVLNGLRQGHLIAFIDTGQKKQAIKPTTWPDVTNIPDTSPKTFASLVTDNRLKFNFSNTEATFTNEQGQSFSGSLLIDKDIADQFQALFKLENFHGSQAGKWRRIGTLGELAAMVFGDLLGEWSVSTGIDPLPMRKTIFKALKQLEHIASNRLGWCTPDGVFDCHGTPISKDDILNMEKWAAEENDEFERHWTDSWVIGREWLRSFCEQDSANRPFPPFWKNPTPQPPILVELNKRPSPLKGRRKEALQERNQQWLSKALEIMELHPDWSKSRVCQKVAKDRCLNENPETIRRRLGSALSKLG
ncbi:MAG: hypothetical protein RIC29_03990 [Rhodospirillaceae bacterium]